MSRHVLSSPRRIFSSSSSRGRVKLKKKRSVRTRPVAVATYVKRLKGPRLLSSQAIDSLKAVISLMRRPTENAIIHSSQ